QQVSAGGGIRPVWSRDGRELFFSNLDFRQILAVPMQSGTPLLAGRPRGWFEFAMLRIGGGAWPYDVAPNGRFLIIRSGQWQSGESTGPGLPLGQTWFGDL